MKFKTKQTDEADAAFEYLTRLVGQEAIVDIKKVSPTRSLSQNSYLHLILGAFGAHFGYTLEEAKTLYKREVNPDIFVYEKNGIYFLKSSAHLTTAELTKTIDRFREYSATHGYPLPTAENKEALLQLENLVESNELYL